MTTHADRIAAAMSLDFSNPDVEKTVGAPVNTPGTAPAIPDLPELQSTPASDEPPTSAEAPPAAAPITKPIPKLGDIEARVAAKHRERVQRQQASEDARLAAEYRKLQAEGKLSQQAEVTPDRILDVFRGMKPDERTAVLRSLVTETRSPDAAAVERSLRAEIADLKTKIVDPDQVVQKTREQLANEAAQAKTEADFNAVAGDSARFPNVARLSPADRVRFARQIVNLVDQYDEESGEPPTYLDDEIVASMMEQQLAARAQPATPSNQAAAGTQQQTPNGTASGTLNDLAASAPAVKPQTEAERRAAAKRMLENWPQN